MVHQREDEAVDQIFPIIELPKSEFSSASPATVDFAEVGYRTVTVTKIGSGRALTYKLRDPRFLGKTFKVRSQANHKTFMVKVADDFDDQNMDMNGFIKYVFLEYAVL